MVRASQLETAKDSHSRLEAVAVGHNWLDPARTG